jgi:hypothetical protein
MEALSLPVDILCLVFDHLTRRDLKKVRLVNRALHKLVSLRITRVFLSPNRTNIDAFRGIASSVSAPRFVRSSGMTQDWSSMSARSYRNSMHFG